MTILRHRNLLIYDKDMTKLYTIVSLVLIVCKDCRVSTFSSTSSCLTSLQAERSTVVLGAWRTRDSQAHDENFDC